MPQYTFHIQYDNHHDKTVAELQDRDAAWKEATFAATQILRDLDGALRSGQEWRMDVADEAGTKIGALRLLVERY